MVDRPTDRGWVEDFIYREDARDPGSRDVPVRDPQWSGLLDARGNRLMRLPNPVGFGRHRG